MGLIDLIKKAGLHNKEWAREEMDESSQASSQINIITLSRLQICTAANLLLKRIIALPSICLLWRVDIHILLLRCKRDWWRLYRLYYTENSQHRDLSESRWTNCWGASWSQNTAATTEMWDMNCQSVWRHSRCPSWTVRKQGAGELAAICTRCSSLWCTQQQSSPNFNPFTPKKVNLKFFLQPHHKYYIR